MFGSIGGPELLLLLGLAFLLFGPRKLPEIGRSLGRAMAEFRKATLEFKTGLEQEIELEKVQDAHADLRSVRAEIADTLTAAVGSLRRAPVPEPPAGESGPSSPGSDAPKET